MSRLVLTDVRIAFTQTLDVPAPFPNSPDPTKFHNATFILTPSHAQIPMIRAAIKDVATKKWPGQNIAGILQAADAMGKICLHDGNTKPDTEGFPGNLFISARSKAVNGKPKIYGLAGVAGGIIAPGSPGYPYAGSYVRAVVTLFAYGGMPGIPKGVGAGLGDIQFMRDGDAFAGGAKSASAEEFGDISAPIGANDEAAPAATGTGGNPWD